MRAAAFSFIGLVSALLSFFIFFTGYQDIYTLVRRDPLGATPAGAKNRRQNLMANESNKVEDTGSKVSDIRTLETKMLKYMNDEFIVRRVPSLPKLFEESDFDARFYVLRKPSFFIGVSINAIGYLNGEYVELRVDGYSNIPEVTFLDVEPGGRLLAFGNKDSTQLVDVTAGYGRKFRTAFTDCGWSGEKTKQFDLTVIEEKTEERDILLKYAVTSNCGGLEFDNKPIMLYQYALSVDQRSDITLRLDREMNRFGLSVEPIGPLRRNASGYWALTQ